MEFKLGEKVRHPISGFTGIVSEIRLILPWETRITLRAGDPNGRFYEMRDLNPEEIEYIFPKKID